MEQKLSFDLYSADRPKENPVSILHSTRLESIISSYDEYENFTKSLPLYKKSEELLEPEKKNVKDLLQEIDDLKLSISLIQSDLEINIAKYKEEKEKFDKNSEILNEQKRLKNPSSVQGEIAAKIRDLEARCRQTFDDSSGKVDFAKSMHEMLNNRIELNKLKRLSEYMVN